MKRRTGVQGLAKGLAVLRALNMHNDSTALRLSELVHLPRPTVYRLLETLIDAGYVRRGPNGNTFRLTFAVRALGSGYSDEAWVTEVAVPVLEDLRREVVWPSDIATYDNGAMVIRETTNSSSPLAVLPGRAGHRPQILSTALGRCYLAFCPPPEQESILRILSSRGHRESKAAANRSAVMRMIKTTRARGFSVREGGQQPGTTSISVPVMHGGRILAAINIICIQSVIALDQIVARYLAPMKRAAARIEAALK